MGVYTHGPEGPAQACVIWMHGLGANASDMMNLTQELKVSDLALRHVFIDAPSRPVTLNHGMVMPAWYDITGTELVSREDKQGIEASELLIRHTINAQLENSFQLNQIFLAGFSQGGAMALHTALSTSGSLGGVIALSAYLPLASEAKSVLHSKTPFFMGSGQFDPLVLPEWTLLSKNCLSGLGYENIDYHQYPMEHSVCLEELDDLSVWIRKQVQGALQ